MKKKHRTTRWVVKSGPQYLGMLKSGCMWGWSPNPDAAFVFGHVAQARQMARCYASKVYRLIPTGRPRMTMREKWGF